MSEFFTVFILFYCCLKCSQQDQQCTAQCDQSSQDAKWKNARYKMHCDHRTEFKSCD